MTLVGLLVALDVSGSAILSSYVLYVCGLSLNPSDTSDDAD